MYVWTKEAFGDFHGFVAGWTYWIYTIFYFPALAAGQRGDGRVLIGPRRRGDWRRTGLFLLVGFVRAADRRGGMNMIGLNIGKWLQNAGGGLDLLAAADAGGDGGRICGARTDR